MKKTIILPESKLIQLIERIVKEAKNNNKQVSTKKTTPEIITKKIKK